MLITMYSGVSPNLQLVLGAGIVYITFSLFIVEVSSIGCYVCTSINHSDPDCEDKFNSSSRHYRPQCYAGRKGRVGLFPGTDCIKMKAEITKNGKLTTYMVRNCVVDNGGVNEATEIGREDYCGLVNWLNFDNEYMKGCLLACRSNACNGARYQTVSQAAILITTLVSLGIVGRYMT